MTMKTMVRPAIRQASALDIDPLRSLIKSANEPYRGAVQDGLFEAYLSSALDVASRLQSAEVLVAEVDGRMVGTITFYANANDEGMPSRFPSHTAGIRATAVEPSARGNGIGRALVDACIERAEAAGLASIALHTADFMVAAVALYEKAGFRRAPAYDYRASDYFVSDALDELKAIAYVRPIR
jgi:ribosomal protein S18 acetylase RimI-like enzyme